MRQITLVGYGNQGMAWAANLRDSGWEVAISGRLEGAGASKAKKDGFKIIPADQLLAISGPIALLMPDEAVPDFFEKYLKGGQNRHFIFAHGFAVVFSNLAISESDDLILVAPKGIGQKLRENYVAGSGVMGVLGVEKDASGYAWNCAREVAEGLGLTRVGILESTFSAECKTDLLSEQVILCGAVPRLVQETISFLVSKGIDPKLATYECLNELKLITDMMVEHGVGHMLEKVSTAARFGGALGAERILPKKELLARTEGLWCEINNGAFAKAFLEHVRRTK